LVGGKEDNSTGRRTNSEMPFPEVIPLWFFERLIASLPPPLNRGGIAPQRTNPPPFHRLCCKSSFFETFIQYLTITYLLFLIETEILQCDVTSMGWHSKKCLEITSIKITLPHGFTLKFELGVAISIRPVSHQRPNY
jgi:hypothetical protein